MIAITDQSQAAAPSCFWILLTASLVSSLIILDSNIVAVSLPTIGRALGASFTDTQWVIRAYILTCASLLMASGNYADGNYIRHRNDAFRSSNFQQEELAEIRG